MGAHPLIDTLQAKRAAILERQRQLAGKFLKRCTEDVTSAHALLARLSAGDGVVFKELEHLAHRIAGTGALFGFDPLCACASTIERLAEAQVGATAADPTVMVRLMEYLGQLGNELDLLDQSRQAEAHAISSHTD